MNIEQQKIFQLVFKELEERINTVSKDIVKLGYQQRNELIDHVYSGYNNDKKLLSKKTEWKNAVQEHKVSKWVFDLLRDKRDLYGYFEKPEEILEELKLLIKQSEEKELYEIANILNYWRLKLVKT